MSNAKFTIWGFESYLNAQNMSLFDFITDLPDNLNKADVTNNIMMRCNEFELLYDDPLFMREYVGLWYRKNKWTIDKWAEVLEIEYNPIDNYDRTEVTTISDTGTVKNTGTQGINGSTSNTGTQTVRQITDDRTINTSSDDLTHNGSSSDKISAFNSDVQRDNTSTTESSTDNRDISGQIDYDGDTTNTRTDALSQSNTQTRTDDLTETTNLTHTTNSHIHGNIGVTTSVKMLSEHAEFVSQFNVLDLIADLFVTEFCLLVY